MKKARPIQPRHIPSCIREALAMREALRRLGFTPDEIFAVYSEDQVAVKLFAQDREFTITCGPPGMSQDEFAKLWRRAGALWNGTEPGMTETTRQIIFHESEILRTGGAVGLIVALQRKGFTVPVGKLSGQFLSKGGTA